MINSMRKLLIVLLSVSIFACSTNKSNKDETLVNNKSNTEIAPKDGNYEIENLAEQQIVENSENLENALQTTSVRAYPHEVNPTNVADKDLNDFLQTYAPKKLITKIDNKYNQAVMGENGIVCVFPAGCFDLTNPNDSVQIELLEYKKPTDFLFSGLGTVSGSELLETGGTAYVNATVNGKKVGLKKDYLIAFKEPDQPKKEMQLFSGEPDENGQIDWELGGEKLLTNKEIIREITKVYTSKEITGVFPYLTEIYADGNSTNYLKDFRAKNELVSPTEDVFFNIFESLVGGIAKFDIDKIEVNTHSSGQYEASYTFKAGKLENNSRNQMLDEYLVKRHLKGSGVLPNTQMVFKITDKPIYPVRKIVDITEVVRLQVIQSNTYITKQLGWINCDRFPQNPNQATTQIAFNVPNMKSVKVQLYFPSLYSFLPLTSKSNQFISPNISKGELVKVVVFGINDKNEKVMSCQDVKITDKKPLVINKFVPFSKKQLLKDLDS